MAGPLTADSLTVLRLVFAGFVSSPGLKEIFSIKTGFAAEDPCLPDGFSTTGAETFFTVLQLAPRMLMPAKRMISLNGFVFNRNIGMAQDSKYIAKMQAKC